MMRYFEFYSFPEVFVKWIKLQVLSYDCWIANALSEPASGD